MTPEERAMLVAARETLATRATDLSVDDLHVIRDFGSAEEFARARAAVDLRDRTVAAARRAELAFANLSATEKLAEIIVAAVSKAVAVAMKPHVERCAELEAQIADLERRIAAGGGAR
jgi:hypothetical protein